MSFWLGVGVSVFLISALGIILVLSESTIPPTPAFYQVVINDGTNVTSHIHNDVLYLNYTNGITIQNRNDTLVFSLSSPTNTELGGIFSSSCSTGMTVDGVDGMGYVICSELPDPTPTRHGGLRQGSCGAGQFVTGIDGNGLLECGTP